MSSRKLIVPIFVVSETCPGTCVFCRTRHSGELRPPRISPETIIQTVRMYRSYPRRKPALVELAFYGGSFTALDGAYKIELLETAARLYRDRLIDQIRISTRPDCLDEDELEFLARYHVRTVEIGAQSFNDEALTASRRGHTAADVTTAVYRLRQRRFAIGIHLMAGLPGDTREGFLDSIRKTIALKPNLVRVHPTLVLAGTPLAGDFAQGRYIPLSAEEAIWAGRAALSLFSSAGIPLARLGLQSTPELDRPGVIVAGYHHPALRTVVEESLFFDMASILLQERQEEGPNIFFVSPGDIGSFIGRERRNISRLISRFRIPSLEVKALEEMERLTVALQTTEGQRKITMDRVSPVV